MHAVVIGFGISGRAAAELLARQSWRVTVVDRQELPADGVTLKREGEPVGAFDLLVVSPGVAPSHPLWVEARQRGIEVVGEAELALRGLKNRCVGVTGTNGKTTTVLLVTHVLQTAGLKARALGNVGVALSRYALVADPDEVLVIELSSYQLETMHTPCLEAAVHLNLTPDHLERYGTMERYARAKARIEAILKPGGPLFVSDQVMREWGHLQRAPLRFEREESGAEAMRRIRLGLPERQNVQAARALCRAMGVGDEPFAKALQSFRKPAHRIEFVGEKGGVSFYNDSKGTNVDAVLHAVALMEGPLVILIGGVDKGASYQPWIEPFRGKVHRLVAFGQAAEKMERELSQEFAFSRVETMEEALDLAIEKSVRPMNLLLSPGCSSYDQFKNYEHRGNEFKRIVFERMERM